MTALLAPPEIPYVDIALRTGLRLEQITAKLQTIEGLEMDPREFYELAKAPPEALIDDYPWLKKALADAPDDASLEGFLWPASYRVLPDTTPDELVRLMLDGFVAAVGEERLNVPEDAWSVFFEILTLASIVEREAVLDEERAEIAGVYQNRIKGIKGVKNKLLNADPTYIYAVDTVNLDAMDFEKWQEYVFWTVPEAPMAKLDLPESLLGYDTYTQAGLPPGPIATPTLKSIDAALSPNTKDKFIYFLAIPDGGGAHVFAKTSAQHEKNKAEYGYSEAATGRAAEDFAPSPTPDQRSAWADADARRSTRAPGSSLRDRFAGEGIDAYFGVRPRAHALPDRLHPGRRGGEGRRNVRAVLRRDG